MHILKLKIEFELKRGLIYIDHMTITKTNDGKTYTMFKKICLLKFFLIYLDKIFKLIS